MYKELYDAWTGELRQSELQRLSSNFYSKAANYLKKLKRERRMLDRKSVKAKLLEKEMQNVRRMISELIQTRYKKLVNEMSNGGRIKMNDLTTEEQTIYKGFKPFTDAYKAFTDRILHMHLSGVQVEKENKQGVLRFVKDVPEIIGVDMKAYGPFKAEDVASLPLENCETLVKQDLAKRVDV